MNYCGSRRVECDGDHEEYTSLDADARAGTWTLICADLPVDAFTQVCRRSPERRTDAVSGFVDQDTAATCGSVGGTNRDVEQFGGDPSSANNLGNYPQALTHAAFVRAALTLRDNTRHSPDEPAASPAQTLDFNGMT